MTTREAFEELMEAGTSKESNDFADEYDGTSQFHNARSRIAIGFHAGRHSADDLIRRMMVELVCSDRMCNELITEAQAFLEDK